MALKSFWSLQEVTEKGFASKQLTINKGFCSWLIEDPKKQLIILKYNKLEYRFATIFKNLYELLKTNWNLRIKTFYI